MDARSGNPQASTGRAARRRSRIGRAARALAGSPPASVLFAGLLLLASAGAPRAASFVHATSTISSTARDSDASQNRNTTHQEPGPFEVFQTASLGANHLSTWYSFEDGRFDVRWEHDRGSPATGPILPSTNTTLDIRFSVDADTTYAALGAFSAIDPLGKRLWFQVFLRDRSTMQSLFWSEQDSQNLPDPELVLGGSGSEGGPFSGHWYTGRLSGSLTGELLAGREYQLWIQAIASDMLFSEPTRTLAQGSFSMVVLPEPGTAQLVGLGLAGLGLARSRRWSRTAGAGRSPVAKPSEHRAEVRPLDAPSASAQV